MLNKKIQKNIESYWRSRPHLNHLQISELFGITPEDALKIALEGGVKIKI